MTDQPRSRVIDRRDYLSLVGAATLGLAATDIAGAASAGGAAAGTCDEVEELAAERDAKRERIDRLLEEISRLRDERRALEPEIERVRKETREQRARFPQSVKDDARRVADEISDSVVSFYGNRAAGWFVAENVVATSWQVGAWASFGQLPDGTVFDVNVIESSRSLDLALIETESAGQPLPAGDSTSLSPGQKLLQVTHHQRFGRGIVTLGEFTGRDDSVGEPSLWSDVPKVVESGGGGPTLTLDGELVGSTRASGPWPETLPSYLDREIYHEPLPDVLETSHVPIETIQERVEAWT